MLDQISPLLVQLNQIPHVVKLDLCKMAGMGLVETFKTLSRPNKVEKIIT